MNQQTQKEILQIVKNNYDKIADHYAETRKKVLWPELFKLAEPIQDNDKVLDVGCGSGKLLQAFTNKKINYLGVDPCPGLIESAKKDFPEYKFISGDILNLNNDLSEINFDYVFCIAVLQHIPSYDLRISALKQLRNKVKKEGKVIISVWDIRRQKKYQKLIWKFFLLKLIGKNQMDFGDILFDWKNKDGKILAKRYYHAFSIRELKKISHKAGFKIKKVARKNSNIYLVLGR